MSDEINNEIGDTVWLHGLQVCRIEYLAQTSGLSKEELEDLVDNGVILPSDSIAQPSSFPLRYVLVAKMARRLRDDFQLDQHGLSLALTLLRRIEELETEIVATRARGG